MQSSSKELRTLVALVVKQMPYAINIRINRLSSSNNIFNNNNNKDSYYEALYNSGYKRELEYLDTNKHHIDRGNNIGNKGHNYRGNYETNNVNIDNKISKNFNNKHRNIIWFNPPFCKLSNINMGKYILSLISKHFKDSYSFRKTIN